MLSLFGSFTATDIASGSLQYTGPLVQDFSAPLLWVLYTAFAVVGFAIFVYFVTRHH